MSALQWAGVAAGVLVVVLVAVAAYGRWRWERSTAALVARLESVRAPARPARYDVRELEGLPLPVQRYFRTTLTPGQPIVTALRIEHTGTMDIAENGERWKPFTSTQRIVTRRPGFAWDARVALLPGLAVHVHDAYAAGEGILHAAIGGLVTLVDVRGGAELARGELMRFVAESAWYPTALLPSQGVRWEAVGDRSARATLGDGPIVLTMTFGFDDDGSMRTVRADARGRTVGGKVVPTPWEGRWSGERQHDGMRVPTKGEVAWLLPEGRKPYWRGEVASLAYTFASGTPDDVVTTVKSLPSTRR